MKLNSKYFDSIRVKPSQDRTRKTNRPTCDWAGCDEPAEHPAPKGRGRDGEYFRFCIRHVREYNKSYNYFNGMSDEDVESYQLDAMTGHRPTWSVGNSPSGKKAGEKTSEPPKGYTAGFSVNDRFELFGNEDEAPSAEPQPKKKKKRGRPIRNLERKHLNELHLDDDATAEEIKAKFKEMVKLYHPDLNGGDNSSVDRLREIIQAYNYLKQAGLC